MERLKNVPHPDCVRMMFAQELTVYLERVLQDGCSPRVPFLAVY